MCPVGEMRSTNERTVRPEQYRWIRETAREPVGGVKGEPCAVRAGRSGTRNLSGLRALGRRLTTP